MEVRDGAQPPFSASSSFVHLYISLYFPDFLEWAHIPLIVKQEIQCQRKDSSAAYSKLCLAIHRIVMLAISGGMC